MTANELQTLLSAVPPEIELVVGDPDRSTYFAPTINTSRYVHLWKLVQENPSGDGQYITYFSNKADGEREREASSLRELAFSEVECMRI